MLDFPLELESPLFTNARAMHLTKESCWAANMPWEMCQQILKEQFSDLNRWQYMELRYELAELRCALRNKRTQPFWDYTRQESQTVRRLLELRSDPDFNKAERFIQFMGRATRPNTRVDLPSDLIGQPFSLKLSKLNKLIRKDDE